MSLPVVLEAEARAEFDDGFDYYEAQRVGLGDDFVAALRVVLRRIGTTPRLHQFVLADIR